MLKLIFPEICVNCWKEGSYLCNECKKKLQTHPPICPYCHQNSTDFKTCKACKNTFSDAYLEGLIIWFSYNNIIKKLILKLKYFHKKTIAEFIAKQLKLFIVSNQSIILDINNSEKTIITWIPSHRIRKYIIKWYNQSYLIAKKLSQLLWYKFEKILWKKKNTKSQVKLNKQQRKENLKNVFWLLKPLNWNETIIVVDDITTTWATINEFAKTIKNIYPNIKIRWIVIARHDK